MLHIYVCIGLEHVIDTLNSNEFADHFLFEFPISEYSLDPATIVHKCDTFMCLVTGCRASVEWSWSAQGVSSCSQCWKIADEAYERKDSSCQGILFLINAGMEQWMSNIISSLSWVGLLRIVSLMNASISVLNNMSAFEVCCKGFQQFYINFSWLKQMCQSWYTILFVPIHRHQSWSGISCCYILVEAICILQHAIELCWQLGCKYQPLQQPCYFRFSYVVLEVVAKQPRRRCFGDPEMTSAWSWPSRPPENAIPPSCLLGDSP